METWRLDQSLAMWPLSGFTDRQASLRPLSALRGDSGALPRSSHVLATSLFVLTCDLAWGPQESRALGRGWCSGSLLRALIPGTGEGTAERNRRKESQHRIMLSTFTATERASEGIDRRHLSMAPLSPWSRLPQGTTFLHCPVCTL